MHIQRYLMKLIEDNSHRISALCEKHKVGKLLVFGSILTDRFNEDSDVDMVVDFYKVTLEDYAEVLYELQIRPFAFVAEVQVTSVGCFSS